MTTRAGVGESEATRGEGKWGGARVCRVSSSALSDRGAVGWPACLHPRPRRPRLQFKKEMKKKPCPVLENAKSKDRVGSK